ncbi:TIGR03986 family CRISPR-associated RAMP protein [Vibrio sp. F13]|uniref:TIGR03986 family type III CRISPR-associated RAMP protein n=1 Tax=Vibrio sp. F13 TaxID=2070777 RepID=UPI0010BD1B22|nr:TIGR03986 family CRISPR-associated RAMP protein [Vibrio sp. F13]TKF38523.1 TIGR03986 family CRISPR-associated RAMP protein [Vibrio sp. F13]
MSHKIHAPYHFVPLSQWVHMPEWAHLVSHDHPFEDGHSGVIEYTLINKTPLCVGSDKDANGVVKFARDPLGHPIIPGSSLKGMIRNVLEIASFGKFSSVDNKRFSFRDILSRKGNYLTNVIAKNTVQSGWVKFDSVENEWKFTPCSFVKVSHKEIKLSLKKEIKNSNSSIGKYHSFPLNNSVSARITEPKGKQRNRWAEGLAIGGEGNLVFTNMRIPGKGDRADYEFSYYFYPKHNAESQVVTQQVFDLFDNHTSVEDEIDGIKWNQVSYLQSHQHSDKGIPVFALIKKHSSTVHSLGFAKMSRVTFKHSIHEMIESTNKAHLSDAYFDFPEVMFGTLRDKGLGLKSRVMFSDAISEGWNESALYPSNPIILSEPKATFYPAYIEQNKNESGYRDYDSDNGALSGYKRYIAKSPKQVGLESNVKDNDKVAQRIELAPVGKSFKGRVVFHNLKTVELSALLWCLNLKKSNHQLGHGKPMGAGLVSISPRISHLSSNKEQSQQQFDAQFEQHMNEQYPATGDNAWLSSPQLKYLLQIGKLGENDDVNTRYMSIDNKDYQDAKKKMEKLPELHGVGRTEPVAVNNTQGAASFGRGRLAHLVDLKKPWDKGQYEKASNIQKEQTEEEERLRRAKEEERLRRAKEEEVRKTSLSKHANIVFDLNESLIGIDASERPPLIREAIHFFLDNVHHQESSAAKELYQLARNNSYHQKPKRREKDQKAELAELIKEYGVAL